MLIKSPNSIGLEVSSSPLGGWTAMHPGDGLSVSGQDTTDAIRGWVGRFRPEWGDQWSVMDCGGSRWLVVRRI